MAIIIPQISGNYAETCPIQNKTTKNPFHLNSKKGTFIFKKHDLKTRQVVIS